MNINIRNIFKCVFLIVFILCCYIPAIGQNNHHNINVQQLIEKKIRKTDSLRTLYPTGNYPHVFTGGPKTTGLEQDCMGALNVCDFFYDQPNSYTGFGSVQEIPSPGTYGNCLSSCEQQTVWYVFTVQNAGTFGFQISTSYDYDWALYDITATGCSGIPTATPIRCNYSATYGPTGMTADGALASEPASGQPFSTRLAVSAGQTFALVIDNYTQDNTGYTLDFGSICSPANLIVDGAAPTLVSAVSNCNHTITATFSEFVKCSSFSVNSFALSGNDISAVPFSVVGVNCTGNGLTKTAIITYTGGTVTGLYNVTIGSSPPTDKCGTPAAAGSVQVKLIDVITASASAATVCVGSNSNLSVNDIATATYSWNPSAGLSNSAIYNPVANAPASTTTYTANVTYGGCTKSTTATVTVQNPPVVSVSPLTTVICSGGTQVLTASSTVNGSNCASCTYSWTGTYIGTANPTPAQGAGTYTVVAITPAPASCSSTTSATATISVNTLSSTCNIFYVSPEGGGTGLTSTTPTTLLSALNAAQCNGGTIKMTVGIYPPVAVGPGYTNYFTVKSNTTIEGGYSSDFSTKTSRIDGGANSTTIRRDATADDGAGINVSAFKIPANSSNFRFQNIRIEMPGSGTVPDHTDGTTKTNYAIYLGSACSNYNIVRCYIHAGKGAKGITGGTGTSYAASVGGGAGSPTLTNAGGQTQGSVGVGLWGAGGNGGLGGLGDQTAGGTGSNGAPTGFGVGLGGNGQGVSCGSTGSGVAVGGGGGGVSRNGVQAAQNPAVPASFTYASNYFVPGGTGAAGVAGTEPLGGIGGGGGGYINATTWISPWTWGTVTFWGGIGGSGGGAGRNGGPGVGGGPGGGAFGVFSVAKGANGLVTSCYITATAGPKGTGGTGGAGAPGGLGSVGCNGKNTLGNGVDCDDNKGGRGGDGGDGALGGQGADGAIGDFALVSDITGGTTLTKDGVYANTNIHTQTVITVTDISCTATNMNFTAAAAVTTGWNFGLNASPATSGLQNPTGITYSAINFKDIIYNGVTYYGFVNIITTAPTNSITSSATGVCPDISANFLSNQSGNTGFTYSWSVPAPPSGVSVSASSGTTTSSANFSFDNSNSTTQVVTVQLDVKSQCCGIATVTKDINVYPLPIYSYTLDNATPCVGGSVVYTATSNPVGASFTWWNAVSAGSQLGSGNTYTLTPVVSGSNNDVWIEATNSNGCVSPIRLNADANGTATAAPTPTNGTTCSVGDVLLSVAPVSGATSYNWYSSNCSGSLQTGPSPYYLAPNVSVNTTFYVAVSVGSCSQSACAPVTATLTNINPSILTWNGSISTDWFNQANWDANACAPGCGTEVLIPASVTREPIIDVSATFNPNNLPAYCGKLSIHAARTLTLNKSELQICGDYTQRGTFVMNGGLVTFNGSALQKFRRSGSSIGDFKSVVINNAAGLRIIDSVGFQDFTTDEITLTNGKVATEGGRTVYIKNSGAGAIAGQSATSYINGWLKRTVVTGNTYEFPVGNTNAYQRMTLTLNSATGLTDVTAWFYNTLTDWAPSFTLNESSPAGKYVSPLAFVGGSHPGMWVIKPNAGYSAVNYDLTLYGKKCGSIGSYEHTIVKRNEFDCAGSAWALSGTYVTSSKSLVAGDTTVTVQRSGLCGFSKFSIAKALWPLPVELMYFDGSCNEKDNTVVLSWITASETNNNFFAVERSLYGETYQQIGMVNGAGNSSVAKSYSFVVHDFPGSTCYYRLKQTDFDGVSSYSPVITVDCTVDVEFELINMIPNPAKDNLFVIYKDGVEEPITITVLDVVGKVIFTDNVISQQGLNNQQLDFTKLSAGVYFIHITNGDKTFIKKIFK